MSGPSSQFSYQGREFPPKDLKVKPSFFEDSGHEKHEATNEMSHSVPTETT